VGVPPQVLLRLLGLATVNPLGRTSEKLRPVSWIPELLVIEKLKVTGTPTKVVLGLKLLVNVGAGAAKGPGGRPTMLEEGLGVGRGGIAGAETGGGTRGLGWVVGTDPMGEVDGSPTPVPPGSVFGFCTPIIGPGRELIGFPSRVC